MAAKKIVILNKDFEGLMGSEGVQRLVSHQLPARLSYPLAILMKDLQSRYDIYLEKKMEIIERYCDKDEKGRPIRQKNQFSVPDENSEEFLKEYNDFLDLETKINHEKISVSLEYLEEHNLRLSVREILQLEHILEIRTEEQKKPARHKIVPMGKKKKAAQEQKS